MESDSKISQPFFRAFRRENSDFFPLGTRHSVFVDRNINPLRSSGIFNNRRGSDAGIGKKSSGEPILTDFVKRTTENPTTDSNKNNYGLLNNRDRNENGTSLTREECSFLRPRREKTESDIMLRHSEARKGLRENLEARRREVESQLAREADNTRRRASRTVDSVALSTATNSINGEEYLYLQVNFTSFYFSFFLFFFSLYFDLFFTFWALL